MQNAYLDDTIAAISTAVGQGGIGIIRLSGKEAIAIADKIFSNKHKTKPSEFKNNTVHFGWIVKKENKKEEIIDEVLLTVMRAPKSYTAEDVVEISCHGGVIPLKSILHLTIDFGARPAEPGEFTKRAFLNGRMDLTQAEAVLDIIQAKTDAFLRVSLNQLKGELTLELESIRENLMTVYTHMEAIVNFPEDEVNAADKAQLFKQAKAARKKVEGLLKSSDQGKILKEGIKVVLCGKPNVGKSSLLNVLLKQPRAIVTDIAGTTRDTIEETAQIRGIPFQLVDTAGILEPRDLVEKEAVKRSHLYIDSADLVLFVIDNNCALSKEDLSLVAKVKDKNTIVLINKSDLKRKINKKKVRGLFKGRKIIEVSALKTTGVHRLEEAIVQNVWHGKITDTPRLMISNTRHVSALKNCLLLLKKVEESFSQNLPFELIAEDIKSAVSHLDNITGRNVDSDLIDKIFSEFCIGK